MHEWVVGPLVSTSACIFSAITQLTQLGFTPVLRRNLWEPWPMGVGSPTGCHGAFIFWDDQQIMPSLHLNTCHVNLTSCHTLCLYVWPTVPRYHLTT